MDSKTENNQLAGTAVGNSIQYALERGFTIISEQGSSRSGKTYNTMLFLIGYCLNNPNTCVSIVRSYMPTIRRSVLKDFENIMQRLNIWYDRYMNKSEVTYTMGENRSTIEFFGADNEQKLRGSKRDILFVNEANEVSFMAWQQLKMRTTKFTILDYNPSFSDEHWICQINQDPRTYHFITTYKDNYFLEKEVVEELESLKTKNQSLWRIYGLGLQAIVEGLVFANTEQIDHFPTNIERTFIGIDYGYSNDPTAIVRVAFSKDRIFVDEIAYNTQLLTSDIIEILKTNCRAEEIISESADPRLVQEIYRARFNIKPVHKYSGSIQAGISKMQEYKICITKSSTNVWKEFKNYTFAQDKEGKWLNTPIDKFNHAIDAIRYVVLEKLLGGVPKKMNLQNIYKKVY